MPPIHAAERDRRHTGTSLPKASAMAAQSSSVFIQRSIIASARSGRRISGAAAQPGANGNMLMQDDAGAA